MCCTTSLGLPVRADLPRHLDVMLISNSKRHGCPRMVFGWPEERHTQFSPKRCFTIVNSDLASTGSDHKSVSYIGLLLGAAVFARNFGPLRSFHATRSRGRGNLGVVRSRLRSQCSPRFEPECEFQWSIAASRWDGEAHQTAPFVEDNNSLSSFASSTPEIIVSIRYA